MSPGLVALGWSDRWEETSDTLGAVGVPARVVRHDGVKVLVADGEGLVHATFPRSTPLAIGDWVIVDNETVTARLPRSTVLERDIGDDGVQTVAANVDAVFVVFGVDRPLRRSKVLRFLAFGWDLGVEPIVVLSKADLVPSTETCEEDLRSWGVEVPVIPVSVETGEGLDQIRTAVKGRTATLIGESGAGKSSLVNALMDDEVAWVGDVRTRDNKGRHTTTHRELHLLPGGGMLIDNPGVRSLGLSAEGGGVEQMFDDIDRLSLRCRFRDCSHKAEPGCAVRAAVAEGELRRDRLDSFIRFVEEQAGNAERAKVKGRREDQKRSAASARRARSGPATDD
jgi:ribosome biogenesis GTPase